MNNRTRTSPSDQSVTLLLDPQKVADLVIETISQVKNRKLRRRLMADAAAGKTVLNGPWDGWYRVHVGDVFVLHAHWSNFAPQQMSGVN